jgi:DNA-binding winged helix-turn-helix (wHTH) protein
MDPRGSSPGAPPSGAAPGVAFVFGPFRRDVAPMRLFRDGDIVALAPRLLTLLHYFVRHPDRSIEKDELVRAVWGHTAVADNNLARLVADLRKALGDDRRDGYIRSLAGIGYRFVARVETIAVAAPPPIDIAALLAPDRAWGDALAALETVSHHGLLEARRLLEPVVAAHPGEARFRIVLAMTYALLYDATRADPDPDVEILRRAEAEARAALQLNPHSTEAMAALGVVRERQGDHAEALTALRNAARLDDGNWLHHGRLAWVAWGEERIRAARRTLELNPGWALAYWLIATVLVARGALVEAERHVDAGIALMARGPATSTRFAPVALYYLKGLLRFAAGAVHEAIEAFDRELALECIGHIFSRECCAHTSAAKGLLLRLLGDEAGARAAFIEARTRVPGLPMAEAGLAERPEGGQVARLEGGASLRFERTTSQAGLCKAAGDLVAAVSIVEAALVAAPPGNTGWLLAIEPQLRVWEEPDAWASALAIVRERAW